MEQRPGDRYRCTNPMCGCEVVISRSGGDIRIERSQGIVCSCGRPMKQGWSRPIWIPSLRRGSPFGTH
jgi:hypothetical protein